MRRALQGAIAAGAAAMALSALAPAAGAAEGPAADRARLGSCPEDVTMQRLRCGRIRVPLERADPSLGKIRIAFAVRRPDDRRRPPRGTIFAVEGGPGYGSIDSAPFYRDMLGRRLLRRFRLVTVDMRGTGHSEAVDCRSLQKRRGTDSQGVAQCARKLGDTFASYRTSAAADDLESVRRALGLGRITMYGDSYGTFLTQSYAYRHGEHLKAMIVDSAYPVRGESAWYPSLIRHGVASLSIACRRTPACEPGAARRLARIVPRLRRTKDGAGKLLDAIGSAGYVPAKANFSRINRVVAAYLDGDREPYERLTAPWGGTYGHPRSYSRGLELAVSCNDYPMIWEKASPLRARKRELRRAVRDHDPRAFTPFSPREVALESFSSYRECIRWPGPTPLYEPPASRGAPAPAIPALVIAGELDNVTSPYEASKVARAFPDARLRVIRNAGHVPSLYGNRFPAAKRVRKFIGRFSG